MAGTIGPAAASAQSPVVNSVSGSGATTTLRTAIDTTVSPCDDFDQYANGAWRIAPDSNKFTLLEDAMSRVDGHLVRILESAKAVTANDPTLLALGVFYASCLVADSIPPSSGITPSGRKVVTREDECILSTQNAMGSALHYAYVHDVMQSNVVLQGRTLVSNIRTAMREHAQSIGWIGDTLQQRFATILDTMTMRIQFASDTVDYSRLVLNPNQYAGNLLAIAAWEKNEYMRRRDSLAIRKGTLESSLVPYAPIVQARRGTPIIEVTPLFFQPPFFDINAEAAVNYATLGSTLAHEMWHLLTPYFKWMNNTEGRRRVTILVEHYAKFDKSGWNTINEDLSDIGGVLSAYAAWQKYERKNAADRIGGFTPEQRFFLYYARKWRGVNGLGTDSYHSRMRTRVNGVLMHVPAFASAFGCKETDEMVVPHAKRANIF